MGTYCCSILVCNLSLRRYLLPHCQVRNLAIIYSGGLLRSVLLWDIIGHFWDVINGTCNWHFWDMTFRGTTFIATRVSQIRRPKVEGRKKAETRRPKPESPAASGFGLRISELGLLSGFGLRTSDFKSTPALASRGGEGEAPAHQGGRLCQILPALQTRRMIEKRPGD